MHGKQKLTAEMLKAEQDTLKSEYLEKTDIEDKKLLSAFKKHLGVTLTNAIRKYNNYSQSDFTFTSEYKELSTLLSVLNIRPTTTDKLKKHEVKILRDMLNNPSDIDKYFNAVTILEKIAKLPTANALEKKLKKQFTHGEFGKLQKYGVTFDTYVRALNNINADSVYSRVDDGKIIFNYYNVYTGEIVETTNAQDVALYVQNIADISTAQYYNLKYERDIADKTTAQTIADMLDDIEI